jgi:putative tricarboxylic transport membrane protein
MTDKVILGLTILLTAVYFYATSQIPTLEIGDPLGPKAFPRLLGIGMVITAAMLIGEMWRARKTATSPDTAADTAPGAAPEGKGHYLVIMAVVAATFVYFLVFEKLGYIISTTIFLIGLTAYFNRGKWKANVLTAVLYSVGSYIMFVKLLGTTLPAGLIPY